MNVVMCGCYLVVCLENWCCCLMTRADCCCFPSSIISTVQQIKFNNFQFNFLFVTFVSENFFSLVLFNSKKNKEKLEPGIALIKLVTVVYIPTSINERYTIRSKSSSLNCINKWIVFDFVTQIHDKRNIWLDVSVCYLHIECNFVSNHRQFELSVQLELVLDKHKCIWRNIIKQKKSKIFNFHYQ